MAQYWVAQRYGVYTLAETDAPASFAKEDFDQVLANIRKALSAHLQVKAHGRPDDHFVTVLVEAESEEAARRVWWDQIEPVCGRILDKHPGLGRTAAPLQISRKS